MNKTTSIAPKKTGRPGRPTTRRPEEAGNSTVLVGIKLLQIIANSPEPETLTQISKRASLTVSRTHRYLKSLTQSNFLRVDGETGKYSIGMAAIELGLAAVSNIDALQLAGEVMRDLTERTGLVSTLSVWGSNGPTIIKSQDTRFDVAVRVREGIRLSLPITAVGQVFLAYAPAAQIAEPLKQDLAAWNAVAPKGKKMTMAMVGKAQKQVASDGLSRATGLRNPAIAGLGAPVFGDGHILKMCLAVIGVIGSFDTDFSETPARELKASAQRLSEMIGGAKPGTTL
jgi:DNA-binding IclR family transcriptional regulator